MIHHFDLAIEVHPDGSATASLSDPGSFTQPITEAGGSTPELALAALAERVTFRAPSPVLRANGAEYVLNPGIPAGCSSPNGHYVGLNVVRTALDLGMHDETAAGAAETYDEWYHREDWAHADHWHDLVADAEVWLNEHTEGGLWHWMSGDFRLDVIEDCPSCGETRLSDPDMGDVQCGDHLSWD